MTQPTDAPALPTLDWYFDYLSPFAYFQLERFTAEPPPGVVLRPQPVLLGALLGACGARGPAEIPLMRTLTYRHCLWQARRAGLPYRMPPAHPFNPLPALRLTVALGAGPDTVRTVFRHLWAEGRTLEGEDWQALCARLGLSVAEAGALAASPAAKDGLRERTEAAIARGVFGVPCSIVHGELFWGNDTTGMLFDFLADPALFRDAEMQRVSTLPAAIQRRA